MCFYVKDIQVAKNAFSHLSGRVDKFSVFLHFLLGAEVGRAHMVTAAIEIFVVRLHVIRCVLRVNHCMAEFTFRIIFVSFECVFLFLLLRPEDSIALAMRVLLGAVEKLTWMIFFHVQQQHAPALQDTIAQKTLSGFSRVFAHRLDDLVFFGDRDFMSLSLLVGYRAELHPALFHFLVWNTQILQFFTN